MFGLRANFIGLLEIYYSTEACYFSAKLTGRWQRKNDTLKIFYFNTLLFAIMYTLGLLASVLLITTLLLGNFCLISVSLMHGRLFDAVDVVFLEDDEPGSVVIWWLSLLKELSLGAENLVPDRPQFAIKYYKTIGGF